MHSFASAQGASLINKRCVSVCAGLKETYLTCNFFSSVNVAVAILPGEMRSMHSIFVILRNDKYNLWYCLLLYFVWKN